MMMKLLNGYSMKKIGIMELELQISEWKGVVKAFVLDLKSDFDVVLGMEWHQEWDLIPHWKELFRNELPDGLPPQRALDHHIDTSMMAPINRSAYPLSGQQLKEQCRQIDELFKHRLIRESTSP